MEEVFMFLPLSHDARHQLCYVCWYHVRSVSFFFLLNMYMQDNTLPKIYRTYRDNFFPINLPLPFHVPPTLPLPLSRLLLLSQCSKWQRHIQSELNTSLREIPRERPKIPFNLCSLAFLSVLSLACSLACCNNGIFPTFFFCLFLRSLFFAFGYIIFRGYARTVASEKHL